MNKLFSDSRSAEGATQERERRNPYPRMGGKRRAVKHKNGSALKKAKGRAPSAARRDETRAQRKATRNKKREDRREKPEESDNHDQYGKVKGKV